MKTFYHGTTSLSLPKILKEGLIPNLENAWKVRLCLFCDSLRDDEPIGNVYVAPDMSSAKMYAESKVRYYMADPGDFFVFGQPELGRATEMYKEHDAPKIDGVTPVVLELVVPDSYEFEYDPKDPSAKMHVGAIPLKYITRYVTPERMVVL